MDGAGRGVLLFRSRRRRKRDLIAWHFVAIIPLLFAMGAAALSGGRIGNGLFHALMLAAFLAFVASMGCVVPAWFDWMGHIFPVRVRGRVMGLAFFASSVAGVGGSMAAAHLLEGDSTVWGYARLYWMAGALATVSLGNVVVGAVGMAAAVGWGVLAARIGLRPVFGACLAVCLAGLAWNVFRVPEPRRALRPV